MPLHDEPKASGSTKLPPLNGGGIRVLITIGLA